MDKIVKSNLKPKIHPAASQSSGPVRPSRDEAEAAVRTLIRWTGDDPDREGLIGTPARVVRAYEEWFSGNFENPQEYLKRTFEEVAGYDEIVLLRDIRFESHCEHHIAPIIGRVHIGYLPRDRVVGKYGDGMKVQVSAAPERGKANAAVVRVLAEFFSVKPSQVGLIGGAGNPRKQFRISGVDPEAAARKLAGLP